MRAAVLGAVRTAAPASPRRAAPSSRCSATVRVEEAEDDSRAEEAGEGRHQLNEATVSSAIAGRGDGVQSPSQLPPRSVAAEAAEAEAEAADGENEEEDAPRVAGGQEAAREARLT